MADFSGKRGLVLGVANRRSIAWAIAQKLAAGGASLAFTYQGDRIEKINFAKEELIGLGVERIDVIVRQMLEHGVRSDLPVALIRWGTTSRQEIIRGTLGNIAQRVLEENFAPPAVAVFGEVV